MSEKQGRGEAEAGPCCQGAGPGPGGGGAWGWGLPGSNCRAALARRAATGHMGLLSTEMRLVQMEMWPGEWERHEIPTI